MILTLIDGAAQEKVEAELGGPKPVRENHLQGKQEIRKAGRVFRRLDGLGCETGLGLDHVYRIPALLGAWKASSFLLRPIPWIAILVIGLYWII